MTAGADDPGRPHVKSRAAPTCTDDGAEAIEKLTPAPTAQPAANPFSDVAKSQYYYDPVLWAVKNEITAGTSATTFSPANPCTRGQIVTFLYRDLAK